MNFLSEEGLGFAVMGKKNSQFTSYIKEYSGEIRNSTNLIGMGSYGIKIKRIAFPKGNAREYFLYLYFDSTKETMEKSGIEQVLLDAKKALEGKALDKNGGLQRTYSRYLIIEETKTGKIKKYAVNKDSVDAMLKSAGYFWIVSSLDMEPAEMLDAYRKRDEIEKCFRIVKGESDMNKTYAQTDTALYAKTMMGFICAIIRSEFITMTREISKSRHNISVQKMLMALDKIIMYRVHEHYVMKYSYTALQQEIMNAIGLKKEDIESVISDYNEFLKTSHGRI